MKDILEQLLKLNIKYSIEDSHYNIKLLNTRIELYKNLISDLENNKPLSFQKKKLTLYNSKLNEYKNKIDELYTQLQEEENMLYELYKNM